MRRTRTVLASGLFTLVLIAGLSVHSARSTADECIAKPTGPTPQGQHWYYRIDHANDGRQCWYLRAESTRVQKSPQQAETDAPEGAVPSVETRVQRAAPPASAPAPESKAAAAAPVPWLNLQKLPELTPFLQPAVKPKPDARTQTADATETTAPDRAASGKAAEPSLAVTNRSAPDASNVSPPAQHRAREPQRRQKVQPPVSPPAQAIAPIDHTFALLMVLFAVLAITGPALHFLGRRRRREAIAFRPPQSARVAALNAPTPRIRPPAGPYPQAVKEPAPIPLRPSDQTERLAQALQQLVDRLQTTERAEPKPVRTRPASRASI